MKLYTSVEWAKLCAEVAKLRVDRRQGATVVALRSELDTARGRVATVGR